MGIPFMSTTEHAADGLLSLRFAITGSSRNPGAFRSGLPVALRAFWSASAKLATVHQATGVVSVSVAVSGSRRKSAPTGGIGVPGVFRDALRLWGSCCEDDGLPDECVREEAVNCINAALQHIYAQATVMPFISRRRQFYRCPSGSQEVALPFEVQQVKGTGREYYVVEFTATSEDDQSPSTPVSPLEALWAMEWNTGDVMGVSTATKQSFDRWLKSTGATYGWMVSVSDNAWRFTLLFETLPTFDGETPVSFYGNNDGGTTASVDILGQTRWMEPVGSEQAVVDHSALYGTGSRAYYIWGGDSNHNPGGLSGDIESDLPLVLTGSLHADENVTQIPLSGAGTYWSGTVTAIDGPVTLWLVKRLADGSGDWTPVQEYTVDYDPGPNAGEIEFSFTSEEGYYYGFEPTSEGAPTPATLTAVNSETIDPLNEDSVKAWVKFSEAAEETIGFSLDVQMEPARYSLEDYDGGKVIPFPNAYIESVLLPVVRWYASNSIRFTAHDRAEAIAVQYQAAMNIIRGLDPAPVVVRERGEPDNPSQKA